MAIAVSEIPAPSKFDSIDEEARNQVRQIVKIIVYEGVESPSNSCQIRRI